MSPAGKLPEQDGIARALLRDDGAGHRGSRDPLDFSGCAAQYYVMRSNHDVVEPGGFSDPQYLVLASLAEGPKHGHAMLDDIERMTGTRLGPGTLYGAIGRLEGQGLIERLPEEERRKPYRLTEAGVSAFAAKTATLERIVAAAAPRAFAR
jgi:DNA-binding MarR family transcriptional regulator